MIRYETTRTDLLYGNLNSLRRQRYIHVLWLLLILWICWSSVHEPSVIHHSIGYKVGFCFVMAALYYVVLFGFTLIVTSVVVMIRKNRGVLGIHTLTLREDGVLEATEFNESLHRWAGYGRTIISNRYLILYVTEVMYLVISRRRPLLEGDLATFEAALKNYTGDLRRR